MKASIIPFRILHFSVPQVVMMQFLRVVADYEITLFINRVSEDQLLAIVTLSIDLTKGYQRDAVRLIEQMLASTGVAEEMDRHAPATFHCPFCNLLSDH